MWPRSWPFRSVTERAVVAQLFGLADIVQDRAGQEQIAVHFGIVRGDEPAERAETHDVVEQSAEIRVMHHFAAGARFSFGAICGSALRLRAVCRSQGFATLATYSSNFAYSASTSISGCDLVVGGFDFFGLGQAHPVDRKLELAAIIFDARLHFHESVALDGLRVALESLPHPGLDRAGAIGQFEAQVGTRIARGSNLFFGDEEESADGLIGLEFGDERRFHELELVEDLRLPKSKNRFIPFFFLAVSGTGETSTIPVGGDSGRVHVAGFHFDVTILAQLLQVVAKGRLHLGHVELVVDFLLDFVEGLKAGGVVLLDLKNEESGLGLDDVGHVVPVHLENLVLDFGRQLRRAERFRVPRLAPPCRRRRNVWRVRRNRRRCERD